jgi:hypothetical protein
MPDPRGWALTVNTLLRMDGLRTVLIALMCVVPVNERAETGLSTPVEEAH